MKTIAVLTIALALTSAVYAYDFDPHNRRDPFTFLREVKLDDGKAVVVQPVRVDIDKLHDQAGDLYQKAYADMAEMNTTEVKRRCGEALKLLGKVPQVPMVWKVEELRQNLMALNKAAEKLHQRREAQKAFDDMRLSVTGVVTRGHAAHAIINGKILRAGDGLESADEPVVVESIAQDKVILLYRGYRMAGVPNRAF
jgi:hypothetical protein